MENMFKFKVKAKPIFSFINPFFLHLNFYIILNSECKIKKYNFLIHTTNRFIQLNIDSNHIVNM